MKIITSLKRYVVCLIGRERANYLSAPIHDRRARQRTRWQLEQLRGRQDLLVNLGCGYRPMDGWINVDRARGPKVQVVWDLSQGLPFASGSCSAVFSEHFIEHIPKEDAQVFLRDCYRILQVGGVLRISTPDAERFLRAYVEADQFLFHPGFTQEIDTPVDRINQMMREGGQHLWSYDAALLTLMLERAGFETITRQAFGQSFHPRMRAIDFDARAFESLYLEAVK